MSPHIFAFAGVAAVLTLIPGADTALVTRNTLTEGRRAALATTLGICSGLSVHATASALGLSAILRVSAIAYATVRFAGAAYLAYLGVQTLCGAGKQKKAVSDMSQPQISSRQAKREASWRCFRQGVFTNLLNQGGAILSDHFAAVCVTQRFRVAAVTAPCHYSHCDGASVAVGLRILPERISRREEPSDCQNHAGAGNRRAAARARTTHGVGTAVSRGGSHSVKLGKILRTALDNTNSGK